MTKPAVLIVEDEGIIAEDLKKSLARLGYAVCGIASTGQEAIDQANAAHPDAILMDIGLPGRMDGLVAARYIQEHQRIPVIFLTAHADVSTLSRVSAIKPAGYILKPYHLRELQTTLDRVLKSSTPIPRATRDASAS